VPKKKLKGGAAPPGVLFFFTEGDEDVLGGGSPRLPLHLKERKEARFYIGSLAKWARGGRKKREAHLPSFRKKEFEYIMAMGIKTQSRILLILTAGGVFVSLVSEMPRKRNRKGE